MWGQHFFHIGTENNSNFLIFLKRCEFCDARAAKATSFFIIFPPVLNKQYWQVFTVRWDKIKDKN